MIKCDLTKTQSNVMLNQATGQPAPVKLSFKAGGKDTAEIKNKVPDSEAVKIKQTHDAKVNASGVAALLGPLSIVAPMYYYFQSSEKVAKKHGLDPKNPEDMKRAEEIKKAQVKGSGNTAGIATILAAPVLATGASLLWPVGLAFLGGAAAYLYYRHSKEPQTQKV